MDTSGFVYYEPKRAKPRSVLYMTVHPLKGASFNSATYEALGKPKFVNLLYHRAKKMVIIRSCDDGTTGAYAVTGEKGRFNITQRSLSDIIYELTNWNREFGYKCKGRYDVDAAGVVFNLNIAEIQEKRAYTRHAN